MIQVFATNIKGKTNIKLYITLTKSLNNVIVLRVFGFNLFNFTLAVKCCRV